ncbi:MAG: transcriptional Regulator, GntR family [Clostridiales bacterium]|jgi:DNA-binding GntR family transcriptional regulator|nr:transcriptional Regulator, GntR family [Clostridiales bacterium]
MANISTEQKINRHVLRKDIKKYLQNAILKRKLKPGERIIETRIAKELGVSQAPVREAIRELELMGLIESVPFKGAIVRNLSQKDINEAYQVRAQIEGLAAEEAAKKISEKHLESLEKLVGEMETAARNQNVDQFVKLDIDFHKQILNIAGNKLLKKLWSLVNLPEWTFITTKISKRSLPDLAERHEAILCDLKYGEANEAKKRMHEHFKELLDEVLQNFKES